MSTELETNRRTLMKVGAWSVPVIAVAAATPAAAASTAPGPPTLTASNIYADYQGDTSDNRYGIHFHATITAIGGDQTQEFICYLLYDDGALHIAGSETFTSFPHAIDITSWLLANDARGYYLTVWTQQSEQPLLSTPVIPLPTYP